MTDFEETAFPYTHRQHLSIPPQPLLSLLAAAVVATLVQDPTEAATATTALLYPDVKFIVTEKV